jgi:hypothetical protein
MNLAATDSGVGQLFDCNRVSYPLRTRHPRCNLTASISYQILIQCYRNALYTSAHLGTAKDSMVADLRRPSHRAIAQSQSRNHPWPAALL